MSNGHANRRDERRKSAIERLEKLVKSYQGQAAKKQKLEKAQTTLENTRNNMGKGSSKLGAKS